MLGTGAALLPVVPLTRRANSDPGATAGRGQRPEPSPESVLETVGVGSAVFSVRQFGARGDGTVRDTSAIQAAIDAAGRAGGRVCLPPGRYRSGTVRLRSHVTLQLEAGATLLASPDPADFHSKEALSYRSFDDDETTYFHHALVRGTDLEDVTILGPGGIDGNRSKRGGPKLVALKQCRQIRIRDLNMYHAPNYNLSLLGCDDVDITGVTIRQGYCDGIDPDSCRNVRIAQCDIESWDDAIVPKASTALGVPRATANLTVTNCVLTTGCNALKLGTESHGGFQNIVFSNCAVFARRDLWKQPPTSGVSLETVDGGLLEGVVVSNIVMADVDAPIFIRLGNRGRGQASPRPEGLRNVSISGLVAVGAGLASSITGIPGHPVRSVTLQNVRITARGGGDAALARAAVPELEDKYPDADMFGQLPAYGLFCRHVAGLTLDGVTLDCERPDGRPALIVDDVQELDLHMVLAAPPASDEPALWLREVRDGFLQGLRTRPGTRRYLRLSGGGTARIRMAANDFTGAEVPLVVDRDVPRRAWRRA